MSKPDFSTGTANGGAGASPYDFMVQMRAFVDELYDGLGDGTDLATRLSNLVDLAENGFLYVNGSTLGARSLADGSEITWTNADGGAGAPVAALATTGVTAGTYSLSTVTVDAKGRITEITAGTTTSGGEANTASSLGAGVSLVGTKTGSDLPFRSLVAGSGISIVADATTVTFAVTSTGEANTASSLGAGSSLFYQKSGVDLQFRGIAGGAGIALSSDSTTLTITVDATAAEIPFTPAGGLAATDVQAALEELDSEKSATGHTHSAATTGAAGFMSAADKTKLDGLDGSTYALLAGATFSGNVTVTGNLTVDGTTFTSNAETVQIADNLMVVNYGEVGAGVTAGSAGIRIDRGSAADYDFLFDESSDLFKVGETGSLQAVATREDSPTDNALPYWDAATSKLLTSGAPTWDGSTLEVPGTASSTGGMPIVTESTTARTFGLSDAGRYVRCTNGSAITLTVPPNSSVAFATGAEVVVIQAGAGTVTFAAGAGVTINSKGADLSLSDQFSAATLKKVATDTWDLIGDLA